jgi:Mce-associated membrane protein
MRVNSMTDATQLVDDVVFDADREDASGDATAETAAGDVTSADGAPQEEMSSEESTGTADPETAPGAGRRPRSWRGVAFRWTLPGILLLLAIAAAVMAWLDAQARAVDAARAESVRAATESTEAMLSYQASTVAEQLKAAEERLTGSFRDSFRELVHDVVIPGSEKKHISTVATVPAAASVSATPKHAVVLVFVNQVAVVDTEAPTDTASIVRVTLEKIDGHWLISAFEPI